MGAKDNQIQSLEEENLLLEREIHALEQIVNELKLRNMTKKQYAGALSFDFWPPKDWIRLGIDKWDPGKYFQLTFGPIRLDFWQD